MDEREERDRKGMPAGVKERRERKRSVDRIA